MTGDLPDYGPQEIQPCDESGEAFAVIRMTLTLTRDQVRAAIATGHAEQAGEPPLDEMDVADIRREVEGYFAAAAVHHTAAHIETVNAALGARYLADLDAALDRAYHLPEPPVMQQPRYGDGTVTVQTSDRGEVTVPEPAWCQGHDSEYVGYFSDFTHFGAESAVPIVTARYGPSQIMTTQFSQAPYLTRRPEAFPVLSVRLEGEGDIDPADGPNLALALRRAAVRVERLVADLEAMRRAEQ